MSNRLRNRWVLPFALAAATGCAPLTFSEPAELDFTTYRSVRVAVNPSFTDPAYATEYLAEELRDGSGFERVTTAPGEPVDLVLSVQVAVSSDVDGDCEIEYEGEGQYVAATPLGVVVAHGSEDDASASATELVEDVLDEVEHFTKKAHVDAVVRSAGFERHTFVVPPFYFQNLQGVLAPQPSGSGSRSAARKVHRTVPSVSSSGPRSVRNLPRCALLRRTGRTSGRASSAPVHCAEQRAIEQRQVRRPAWEPDC
jgi:hypothetical protein